MHKFIERMILRNAVNAALQRANVYKKDIEKESKKDFKEFKKNFKKVAKDWLKKFGATYNIQNENEKSWCNAIADLSKKLTNIDAKYLRNGRVKLGVSQKMVSLYLKYLWLLGNEDKKPLFAVIDRGIMEEAGIKNAPNWTCLDDIEEYKKIVKTIDIFAKEKNLVDGAEWEAKIWSDDERTEEA